ncbi:MAG: DUF5798 family protein [Halanaeroarchaeum sp.]
MGFGSTAKKLQSVVDMADELYSKINELREQMNEMRETIETTNERVEAIDAELDEQRAILEALAENEDVDVPAGDRKETETDETDRATDGAESGA